MPSRTARAAAAPTARSVATRLVLAVDTEEAYANLLLPRLLREAALDPRDAALATELGYGTLRWQGVLDAVLASAARRDVAALDPPVRAVLRVGGYQLLHLRIPAHAAVHETVELARRLCGPRPVGLVNAVLRRVATASWPQWVDRVAPADLLGRQAFAAGYPTWVAAAFRDALGDDADELAAALAADRPVTHLVARPGRMTRADLLAEAGEGAVAGPWSPYAAHLVAGGDPAALPAVREGRAGVQDEGSQLVACAAAAPGLTDRDSRWLDACAGPGGKTALLDGLRPATVRLLAADLQPHRAALVALTVPAADVVVADATRPAWRPATFDRVLLDAPCTGLGALRRRPEVRWRRHPDDVPRLAALQGRLLDAAIGATRRGGVVAYVTCSPHPAETREVVAAARARHPDVAPVDARPYVGALPGLGAGPDVQLWPHRHGTDAMYLALLRVGAG